MLTGLPSNPLKRPLQQHSTSHCLCPTPSPTLNAQLAGFAAAKQIAGFAATHVSAPICVAHEQNMFSHTSIMHKNLACRYMKQLAEDAAELLPMDEADGGKKRGRGRPKKDLRLVDALHQSWQGKVRLTVCLVDCRERTWCCGCQCARSLCFDVPYKSRHSLALVRALVSMTCLRAQSAAFVCAACAVGCLVCNEAHVLVYIVFTIVMRTRPNAD